MAHDEEILSGFKEDDSFIRDVCVFAAWVTADFETMLWKCTRPNRKRSSTSECAMCPSYFHSMRTRCDHCQEYALQTITRQTVVSMYEKINVNREHSGTQNTCLVKKKASIGSEANLPRMSDMEKLISTLVVQEADCSTIWLTSLAGDFDLKPAVKVYTDSTAALGIFHRLRTCRTNA